MRFFVCFVDCSKKTPPLISTQSKKKTQKMEAKVSTEKISYESTIMEMRSYKNNFVCSGLFIDTQQSLGQAHINLVSNGSFFHSSLNKIGFL